MKVQITRNITSATPIVRTFFFFLLICNTSMEIDVLQCLFLTIGRDGEQSLS